MLLAVGGLLVAGRAGPNGPLGGFWGVEPTPGLEGGVLGALIVYDVLQGLAFGVGLAWIAFGHPLTRMSRPVHFAVGWMLVSWFPHGAFHQSISHTNWAGLAALEYGFHLTVIAAALIVAREMVGQIRTPAAPRHSEGLT